MASWDHCHGYYCHSFWSILTVPCELGLLGDTVGVFKKVGLEGD